MNQINIHREASIKAEGKRNCHRCKPIICIETGEVFSSLLDAADNIGCTESAVSAHLCGKSHSVKGKHFCYLSRVSESLDSIVARLRETAAVEADAKKWQAYQAEQEAIYRAEEKRKAEERKAEEKRQAEIAKLMNKRASLNEKCSEYEAKWHDAINSIIEIEKALEDLGVNIDCEDVA